MRAKPADAVHWAVGWPATRHLSLVLPDASRLGLPCSQLMGCLYVDRDAGRNGATERVSDLVRQRMLDTAAGRLPHARPLLLFPEGTTTNGHYLLPFKTGAFLAGQPLQLVVMRYGEVRRGGARLGRC